PPRRAALLTLLVQARSELDAHTSGQDVRLVPVVRRNKNWMTSMGKAVQLIPAEVHVQVRRSRVDGLGNPKAPERTIVNVVARPVPVIVVVNVAVLAEQRGVAVAKPVLLDAGHHPEAILVGTIVIRVDRSVAAGDEQARRRMHDRCRTKN